MPKVYYARPISLYGTPQDKRDIETLQKMGFEVVDPNKKEYEEQYKEVGMHVFFQLVRGCDGLAFRTFPDGMIGAGMWGEIQTAQDSVRCKFIFELPTITSRRILSKEDTREYLKLIGQ